MGPQSEGGKVGLATEAESSDYQAAFLVESDRPWGGGASCQFTRDHSLDGLQRVDARMDENENEKVRRG
jgi:hypothetical protein